VRITDFCLNACGVYIEADFADGIGFVTFDDRTANDSVDTVDDPV
jgi:hypothetical protein